MTENLDELSVRTREKGGTVYRGMQFRGNRGRLTDPRLVILVHGFNVDLPSAKETYQEFRQKLAVQVAPTPLSRYGTFLGFYWPGDHQSRPVSLATFPVRLGPAKEAGEQLARFITRCLGPEQEVFFVAHSLGCRVVLETLFKIADNEENFGVRPRAVVRGVFLMAGAVPYQSCEDTDGALFKRRDPQLRDWVLHSAHDKALKAFPGGQYIAGEGGGEAVGRHGWPAKRWYQDVETKLDHGEYWTTWPLVIENVPAMLGTVVPRQPAQRSPSSRPAAPDANSLPARRLGRRELGTPLGSGWEILVRQS